MIKALCKWLAKHLNSFTIAKDGKKYLTRYYLFGADRPFGNIFLHHFHRSDLDIGTEGYGLLHSHPFRWSFSFVLTGGYVEERRLPDDSVISKIVLPLTFNWLFQKDFHRVDLLDEEEGAWTIFFTGSRKNNSWGFWDRITKQYTDWTEVPGAIE